MNREIIVQWLTEADKLQSGESLFLICDDRAGARALVRQFKSELRVLGEIDPVKASKLMVLTTIRDQMYWMELKKTFGNPLVGFKKDKEGKTIRVELEDPDRRRRLLCMKEDGLTIEEVEDLEGELSDEERGIFKR